MGRASTCLTSLFGRKKEGREYKAAALNRSIDNQTEKKKWSLKSGRISCEVMWLRSFYTEKKKEQTKHDIEITAATAAAAEAAVAAAQAAVTVVRLMNQSRRIFLCDIHDYERLAAIKIQTIYRGYLAKKALRALKALVKLQALVRGYLVRKKAAAALLSIEALMRAQETVRARKIRSFSYKPLQDRFDEASFHSRRLNGLKICDIDTCRLKSRSHRRTGPSILDESFFNSMPSPLPCPVETRRCSSTGLSTPRCLNSGRSFTPPSPAKSIVGVSNGNSGANSPSYMSSTQSFEAKVRWKSGLSQMPEGHGLGMRVPLSKLVVVEQTKARPCSPTTEAFNFRSVIMGKLSRFPEFISETEKRL